MVLANLFFLFFLVFYFNFSPCPVDCLSSVCLPVGLLLLSTTRYKNNVTIDPIAHPGKYKIESSYSLHSLEIDR